MMVGISIQLSPMWVLLVVALGMLPLTSMSTVGWTAMENSPTGVSCSTMFTDEAIRTVLNTNFSRIVLFLLCKLMHS